MNIHNYWNEVINKHGQDESCLLSIALNFYFAKNEKRFVALPCSYRYVSDLKNLNYFRRGGDKADITLIAFDEYGAFHKNDLGFYDTKFVFNFKRTEESRECDYIIERDGELVRFIDKEQYDPFLPLSKQKCGSFDYIISGVPNETKVKIKKENEVLVLDFTHREINQFIEKEIDKLEVDMLGEYKEFTEYGSKVSYSYSIWSNLSELRTCQRLNVLFEHLGRPELWIPVNMRGKSRNRIISDMKKQYVMKDCGKEKKMFFNGIVKGKKTYVSRELYVQAQMEGKDLTLHKIGCSHKYKQQFPEITFLDVKLDHWAGRSGNIAIECYTYTPKDGWIEKGWVWDREGYIAYVVDDMIYVIPHSKLREEVENAGQPTFTDRRLYNGRTIKAVSDGFKFNNFDYHNEETGAGKYNLLISVERAASLAEWSIPVLDAYVHDVAIRADAYRNLEGKDIGDTQDRWLDRMVHKSEILKQRGA